MIFSQHLLLWPGYYFNINCFSYKSLSLYFQTSLLIDCQKHYNSQCIEILINTFYHCLLKALFIVAIITISNQYYYFSFLHECLFHILNFHPFIGFKDLIHLYQCPTILRGYLINLLYLLFTHIFIFQVFVSKTLWPSVLLLVKRDYLGWIYHFNRM